MVKARELLAAAASLQSTVWASATEHQKPITAAAIESGNPFNAEFDELAKDILHQWRVPGMSIAVVDGDHVYAKASLSGNRHLFGADHDPGLRSGNSSRHPCNARHALLRRLNHEGPDRSYPRPPH